MSKYDAIVIGAGHNGLTAGATLACAGLKVLILERRDGVGGMATTTEIHPGFRVPAVAHLLYNLSPTVEKRLNLAYAARDLATISLAKDGHHVELNAGKASFTDGTPHPDAAVFAEIDGKLTRYAAALAPVLAKTPPRLAGGGLAEMLGFTKPGLGVLRLRKKGIRELMRVVLLNIDDLLRDEMPDGPLAGAVALDAVLGGFSGPRSPGNVLVAMYRRAHGGARHLPRGGMGAVTAAMQAEAKAAGCEIRTGAAVAEIITQSNAVNGVRLKDGEELTAPLVLSNLDAKTTMDLTGPESFDVEAARRIRNIRAKACTAKLNLALSARPDFTGLTDAQHKGRIVIAPSMQYTEHAFNHAKYGEISPHPVLEITLPSLSDNSLVKGDGHVLSAVVQYAPYHLKGGWNASARKRLEKTAMAVLEDYAPGISKLVMASQMLTPADLEQEYGVTAGHWHHGELTADQMAMLRPANMMARYAMGPPGLYLCGAGAHPGGDVMGLAGHNAAKQVLKDKRRARK